MGNVSYDHVRKSPRLKQYDYSKPGYYFLTVNTQYRVCFFGDIARKEIKLNSSGVMIDRWWKKLPSKFPSLSLGRFIVMPNHLHGIVIIKEGRVGADSYVRPYQKGSEIAGNTGPTYESAPTSIPRIMQWFKTMTTDDYIKGVGQKNWEPFDGRLWQRSYYDHIIHNQDELARIRSYINNNPKKWEQDIENVEFRKQVSKNRRRTLYGNLFK